MPRGEDGDRSARRTQNPRGGDGRGDGGGAEGESRDSRQGRGLRRRRGGHRRGRRPDRARRAPGRAPVPRRRSAERHDRRSALRQGRPLRGDVLHDGRPGDRGAVALPRGRAAQREGRRSGEPAGRSGRGWLAPADRERDGSPGPAGHLPRGRGERTATGTPAVLAVELRAGGARGGGALRPVARGHRGRAHRAVRGPRGGEEHQRVARPGERGDGGAAAVTGGAAEEGRTETTRGAQLPHGLLRHRDPAHRDGNALHTIRYGRMPQGDAKNLCEGLGADVAALLAKRPRLKVAALCDGAAELWNLLVEPLSEEALGTEVHELVDLWHLLEKLGRAAGVIHGGGSADEVVKGWRLRLLNSSRAAERILVELKQSGREHVPVGESRPVHDAITYIENNGDRMDYATARRRGLPVGSGNVEATCKSLVEVRMKRPGARWKEDSGEHVIQLRAVALSDRWDAAMDLTLRPLRKAVRAA